MIRKPQSSIVTMSQSLGFPESGANKSSSKCSHGWIAYLPSLMTSSLGLLTLSLVLSVMSFQSMQVCCVSEQFSFRPETSRILWPDVQLASWALLRVSRSFDRQATIEWIHSTLAVDLRHYYALDDSSKLGKWSMKLKTVGPSGVRALPLGYRHKRSGHY